MTKQIFEGEIGASGSTTVTFEKVLKHNVALRIDGDSNSTDLTVELGGGKVSAEDEGTYAAVSTSETHSNVDATGDLVVRFVEVDGYEDVQFDVSNNASSATTVTVYAEGYRK